MLTAFNAAGSGNTIYLLSKAASGRAISEYGFITPGEEIIEEVIIDEPKTAAETVAPKT